MKANFFKRNLIVSLLNVVFQFLQSLWITAYVQRMMGIEAYGYVSVIVSIVNMAGVVTVALTSVCSRYMICELETGDSAKAKKVFCTIQSVLLVLSLLCMLVFVIMAINITGIINVSPQYEQQVKILMLIVTADFVLQLLQVPYISVLYYEEKVYYYYIMQILTNISKVLCVVVIFNAWKPVLWGSHIGVLLAAGCSLVFYYCYVRKKYPYLSLSIKSFDRFKLMEILSSGIWVSLSKLAATLLASCSTFLVNILIGTYLAGIYGSVSQIQSILSFVTISVVNVFLPQMLKLYSLNEIDELINFTKQGLKIISSFLGIVAGIFVVLGDDFMALWITEEYLQYNALIIISVCYLSITYAAEFVNQLLIALNKTKVPAIVSIVAGIGNVLLIVFLVKGCDMGIYGVAVSQMIVLSFRSGIFFPVYAAKCLNQKWNAYLGKQLSGVLVTGVATLICMIVNKIIPVEGWISLFFVGGITVIMTLGVILCCDKETRKFVINMVKER